MKPESIVFAVAGAFFGLIVGWVLGTQQPAVGRTIAAPVAVAQPAQGGATQGAAAQGQGTMPPAQPPRPLDEAQAQSLQAAAEKSPRDPQLRVQLGNMYFDAERYQDAAKWYAEAFALDPKDANVSTDLGVSYYYLNQPDRALQQFEQSLAINPKHAKTMLNQGIVKAFGKQDLSGAVAAWEKLVQVAPNSPEAETARKALQGLKSAHPNIGSPSGAPNPGA
jgi:cytochrome c-type biogenesis protein CcmH/NrfG